jgi:hypothetical protein
MFLKLWNWQIPQLAACPAYCQDARQSKLHPQWSHELNAIHILNMITEAQVESFSPCMYFLTYITSLKCQSKLHHHEQHVASITWLVSPFDGLPHQEIDRVEFVLNKVDITTIHGLNFELD